MTTLHSAPSPAPIPSLPPSSFSTNISGRNATRHKHAAAPDHTWIKLAASGRPQLVRVTNRDKVSLRGKEWSVGQSVSKSGIFPPRRNRDCEKLFQGRLKEERKQRKKEGSKNADGGGDGGGSIHMKHERGSEVDSGVEATRRDAAI